jgi:hypothetical protein
MAVITVKIKDGNALVTENNTSHKVVIIDYDKLNKQIGKSFIYAGGDTKNFPYLKSYEDYILLNVGEDKCEVKVRDSLIEERWWVSTNYLVQTFFRNDD